MPTPRADEQTIDLLFGSSTADHIRLVVLGRTFPDTDADWDRALLNIAIYVNVGTFRGYRSLAMLTDEFHRFREGLSGLLHADYCAACLETSDFFSMDVERRGASFEAWMQLDALEAAGTRILKAGGDENWEWRIPLDRHALDALVDAVSLINTRYPLWAESPPSGDFGCR